MLLQSVPTHGAHGVLIFRLNDSLFIGFSNFGDRQKEQYNAISSVWKYETLNHSFIEVGQISTHGATDMEYFNYENRHYLVVTEEGDFKRKKFNESRIFEIGYS